MKVNNLEWKLFSFIILPFLFLSSTSKAYFDSKLSEIPVIYDFDTKYSLLDLTITGKVTDSLGNPLVGVTVSLDGTNIGTVTDASGNYHLNIEEAEGVLIFSFVGFEDQRIDINGQEKIDVILKHSVAALDQLVVVGYGTQKKRDLTGSVSQIDNETLKEVPVSNVSEAMQGRMSGVKVTNNSGDPSSRIEVRIRGGNSMIGDNSPLYVVDGFAISGGVDFLNPNDIESIDVLKDASATAIYGARGANGVVIITTKSGKKGQENQITFNSYIGVQKVIKRFEMLNPKEYAEVANEFLRNNGSTPFFTDIDGLPQEGTDWQGLIFRQALIQDHTITFSGSSEKTQYSLSGNYFKQDGIIRNSGAQRGSVRLKLNSQIKDWLEIPLSINLSRRENNSVPVNNGSRGNNVLSGALAAPPLAPPYDENGLPTKPGEFYPFTDPGDMRSPLLWSNPYKSRNILTKIYVNTGLNIQIEKNLSLSSMAGLEYENSNGNSFSPVIYSGDKGSASASNSYFNSFLNENILTYKNEFNEVHNLEVMGGFTYQTFTSKNFGVSVSGFSNNITEDFNLGAADTHNPPSSGYSQWHLASWLFRSNYSYLDRYLVTFSLRADGSSRFGENNKWGIFPSGAVAWRISEEPFIQEKESIDNLKLRLSYGTTGSTALGPYQSLSRLGSNRYVYGGTSESIGFSPSGIASDDLKWESTSEFDVGLDLGLFNRIDFTFDFYKKTTKNLLAAVPLPPSSGFATMLQNLGEIQNMGAEFSINVNILRGDFNWDFGGQVSLNRNEVKKLVEGSDIVTAGQTSGLPGYNLARVGEPYGVFYGYKEDGLDDEGQIVFMDTNNDGELTSSDRVIIGNPYPDFEFGFNTSLGYRDFKLDLFFQGVYGNDIFFATAFTNLNSFQRTQNQFKDLYGNYWTSENPDPNAKYPIISALTQMRPSDRFIEDGSYLRLKSLRLRYDLPVKDLGIKAIEKLEIYLKATNLFTITNYPGLDPEVNTRGSDSQSTEDRLFIGTDATGYPNARMFGGGIELTF